MDLGGGTGNFTQALAEAAQVRRRILCVDAFAEMLEKASRQGSSDIHICMPRILPVLHIRSAEPSNSSVHILRPKCFLYSIVGTLDKASRQALAAVGHTFCAWRILSPAPSIFPQAKVPTHTDTMSLVPLSRLARSAPQTEPPVARVPAGARAAACGADAAGCGGLCVAACGAAGRTVHPRAAQGARPPPPRKPGGLWLPGRWLLQGLPLGMKAEETRMGLIKGVLLRPGGGCVFVSLCLRLCACARMQRGAGVRVLPTNVCLQCANRLQALL